MIASEWTKLGKKYVDKCPLSTRYRGTFTAREHSTEAQATEKDQVAFLGAEKK
jgi:hypothetical protein